MEEILKLILDKLNSMDSDIKDLKTDVKDLKTDVKDLKKQVLSIETNHGAKLDALLDGYKQLSEGQEIIKNDIRSLQQKQENQELEIRVIKGGK